MKKVITLTFILFTLMTSAAWAGFVDYPTLAWCNAESVRLREAPNTKSKILGKLSEWDFLIVLSDTRVNGQLWYEVDHPTKKGHAYILGKYLTPCFVEECQRKTLTKLMMNIELTYGHNVEKTIALLGEPKKRISKKSEYSDYQRVTLDYGDYSVSYIDNDLLVEVDVNRGDMPFGNFVIGDSEQKLLSLLGKPLNEKDFSSDGAVIWQYNINLDYEEIIETSFVNFIIKNGKIVSMSYEVPNDGSNGG
ncbi:MAG: SH3 domain-containing protein [Synergistaceae bacterium]|nr:SH3 domain-containing protein [Synergistaceae bacterium]